MENQPDPVRTDEVVVEDLVAAEKSLAALIYEARALDVPWPFLSRITAMPSSALELLHEHHTHELEGAAIDPELRKLLREVSARDVPINGVMHRMYPHEPNNSPRRPHHFPSAALKSEKLIAIIEENKRKR